MGRLGGVKVQKRSASRGETKGSPWTPSTAAPSPTDAAMGADPLWRDQVTITGLPAPTPGLVPLSAVETIPHLELTDAPRVAIMGLHGGAGASTVAGLLGEGTLDTSCRWPQYVGWERPLPDIPVVVVTRTHHRGIEAADKFARAWAAGSLAPSRLVGLVVIDDGPRLLQDQQRAVRRLAQLTPSAWHLPWQDTWRIEPPTPQTFSTRLRRTLAAIEASISPSNGATK